ncbi:anion permease [Yersinia kristensenii]|uniref:anion permease n=1 Tax=Yersinia kristensenii TaxID=28152 RepID=UPI0022391923
MGYPWSIYPCCWCCLSGSWGSDPYATGPGVIIYGCGYVKSKDYWRLGGIMGVFYITMLLLVGWPIMSLWY